MRKTFLLILFITLLTACAPTAQSGAARTVEKFLQAINSKDSNTVSALSCQAWEADALMLLDSFQAVTTTLEDLSCEQTGSDPDGRAIVACQGKLVASYNGELQEFNLSIQQYLVENVTGDWLVCGIN